MYCIYTDKDVPQSRGNYDHIIPLALGGRNQFTVWSDREFNSTMGSKIDGAMANDHLISFARYKNDVRGHSNKRAPPPTFKHALVAGKPNQVSFTRDGMKFWDARLRTEWKPSGSDPVSIEARVNIEEFAPARFVAKAALGGGYHVYGDELRNAVDCDVLRRLMSLSRPESASDVKLLKSNIKICDRFHPDTTRGIGSMYKALSEFTGRSLLLLVPHEDGITFNVGILGQYIGSIVMPGNGTKLPLGEGEHDLGHAVLLGPDPIERLSFRNLCARFYSEKLGAEPPPIPD